MSSREKSWWRRAGLGLGMTLGVVLLASEAPSREAGSSRDPHMAKESTVIIKSFDFVPPTLTIVAGETVRWINADVANHQVTSGVLAGDGPRPDGRITSPLLYRDEAFTATLATRGVYPYYCSVHPFMRGTITVK